MMGWLKGLSPPAIDSISGVGLSGLGAEFVVGEMVKADCLVVDGEISLVGVEKPPEADIAREDAIGADREGDADNVRVDGLELLHGCQVAVTKQARDAGKAFLVARDTIRE